MFVQRISLYLRISYIYTYYTHRDSSIDRCDGSVPGSPPLFMAGLFQVTVYWARVSQPWILFEPRPCIYIYNYMIDVYVIPVHTTYAYIYIYVYTYIYIHI